MGAARVTEKIITLEAAGDNDTVYVWDAPSGDAFKNMSVTVSSMGVETVAGSINFTIFNGGRFYGDDINVKPYEENCKYLEGNSVSTGSITETNIAKEIYTDTKKYPPSLPGVKKSSNGVLVDSYVSGYPVVLKLQNAKTKNVKLAVAFISETISDKV